jgi:hypothetical protein
MEEVFGLSAHEKMIEAPALVPTTQPRLLPTLQEQITPAKRPTNINRPFAHQVA